MYAKLQRCIIKLAAIFRFGIILGYTALHFKTQHMKAFKLKTILSALGFFALSTTFAQVDSSKSSTTTTTDVQVGTSATDSSSSSTSATTDVNATVDNSSMSSAGASDSTAAMSKAAKKMKKAAKKEAKATKP